MNAANIRPNLRFIHMHGQVSKDYGDFFPLLSLLSLCCSIKQMTKICFSVFLAITIKRVIFLLFILLNY